MSKVDTVFFTNIFQPCTYTRKRTTFSLFVNNEPLKQNIIEFSLAFYLPYFTIIKPSQTILKL